jgi:hypothetical protein
MPGGADVSEMTLPPTPSCAAFHAAGARPSDARPSDARRQAAERHPQRHPCSPHSQHSSTHKRPRLGPEEVPGADDGVLLAASRPALAELRVSRCPAFTDEALAALLACTPGLHTLCASMTAGVTDATLAVVARACPQVHTLEVRKCAKMRSEEGLVAVAQSGVLQRLDCGLNQGVTGALLLELAASCGRTLVELDISFCRNVQSTALGHLLDACGALAEARVFGCSQVTRACVYGHSNDRVKIVGAPTFEADEAAALLARDGGELLAAERSTASIAAANTAERLVPADRGVQGSGAPRGGGRARAGSAQPRRGRAAAGAAAESTGSDESSDGIEVI